MELGFGGAGDHQGMLGGPGSQSGDVMYLDGLARTLTEDLVCNNLHVANLSQLRTAGFRIFARGDVRVYNNGLIHNGGAHAAVGVAGVGGVGGVGGPTWLVGGGSAGGRGGDAGDTGTAGSDIPNVGLGGDGAAGGASFDETIPTPVQLNIGGPGGVCTYTENLYGAIMQPSQYVLGGMFRWALGTPDPLATDTAGFIRFRGGSGGGGGPGGSGPPYGGGFGGGGGGGGGGVVYIVANNVYVDDGAAIASYGGNGGTAGGIGAAGGGGGGGGLILIHAGRVYLNSAGARLDTTGGYGGLPNGGLVASTGLVGDEGRVMIFSAHGGWVLKDPGINGTNYPILPPR